MKKAALATALFITPAIAFAQTAAPEQTVTLTGIANTVIAGIFGILTPIALFWLQSHMKDQAAAATLGAAIKNSLGTMQQAATSAVSVYAPSVTIKGVSPEMASGIQYVLDNAGTEAARLGITQESIAQKISAQIGLANIATNLATAASPAPSPAPLDPVVTPKTAA
jgi:hypothetical protein